jgi:hypothetical protein
MILFNASAPYDGRSIMTDEMRLKALHKTSMHNRKSLSEAAVCGCFYCLRDFGFDQITRWVDNDDTALCPFCEIDSVLGFDTTSADATLLRQMREYWFERTVKL